MRMYARAGGHKRSLSGCREYAYPGVLHDSLTVNDSRVYMDFFMHGGYEYSVGLLVYLMN